VSPFPEAGNSNSSNSNGSTYSGSGSGSSSSSQGDSNMGGNNDASRSNAEENCNSANAALAGRSQAVLLSEEEMDVLRWGRNSNAVSPPKSVDSRVYKKATALEVLVGYLYLTDTARCVSLVHHLLSLPSASSPR